MASNYNKLSVKQLKKLLDEREIDHKGLNKAGLIDLLLNDDVENVNDEIENVDDADEEIVVTPGSTSESSKIQELKLQLEIEQIKLKQLTLTTGKTGDSSAGVGTDDLMHLGLKMRLPKMSNDCDIIAFLLAWEKAATLNGIPRERWPQLLPTALNAKALQVFAKQSLDVCADYDLTKECLYKAFKATPQSYYCQMQAAKRYGNESYTLFVNRLRDVQDNYLECKGIKTFEQLKDDNLLHMFIASLPPRVQEFVLQRQPASAAEAAEAADLAYSIHTSRPSQDGAKTKFFKNPVKAETDPEKFGNKSNPIKSESDGKPIRDKKAFAPYSAGKSDKGNPSPSSSSKQGNVCYNCGGVGHRKMDCPSTKQPLKSSKTYTEGFVYKAQQDKTELTGSTEKYIFPVVCNGVQDCLAYRDTGAQRTIVASSFVKNDSYTGETVPLMGAFAKSELKVATIQLSSPRFNTNRVFDVKVCVKRKPLPFGVDILIGNDIFENTDGLNDIITLTTPDLNIVHQTEAPEVQEAALDGTEESLRVSKRHEGTKRAWGSCTSSCVNQSTETRQSGPDKATSHDTVTVGSTFMADAGNAHCSNADSDSELTVTAVTVRPTDNGQQTTTRAHETDACKNKQAGSHADNKVEEEILRLSRIDPEVVHPNMFTEMQTAKLQEFSEKQRQDPNLKPLFEKAKAGKGGYLVQNDILYKAKPQHINSGSEYLLVLPECYKTKVLKVAHDDVQSGCHLAYKNTMRKIMNVFYMEPKEIKKYISSCQTCQKIKPKYKNERVEKSIPQIENDFGNTWIIDVMGPSLPTLSKQFGSHKYVIVAIDKATRWVELIPVPSLKAKTVADALLVNIIARYGCKTLVYDQQSAFMSDLFASTMKLLRIHSEIAVAGYHAKTAICERYIRTVEQILKSYIFDYKGKWQLLLPWIAFQLRQTPCETLGYSAHELCFGKNFPDKMEEIKNDLLGESDSDERKLKKNVISYLQNLRDQLKIKNEVAKENELRSHAKTKTWYDKNATVGKKFVNGDLVLILEPDDTRKLYARWIGPKVVSKQLDERNYEVCIDENVKKIFHVNQLRKFHARTDVTASVIVCADLEENPEDENIRIIEDGSSLTFNIEPTLDTDKRDELLAVLREFADVFRPSLGKTDLVTHYIEVTDDKPVVGPTYSMPESLKQPFEEEVNRLLAEGVLTECQSNYRSPIIPIKKPDGSLRLVNNFKALNAKVKDDLYPMANVNEIISKAAGKRYITKIDLSKAFLQVPLAAEHQHLTAWSCFLGTFAWTRMAMGLSNSPRTMQRLADQLLKGLSKIASCLQDDIIVYSNTWHEHLEHLRTVLNRLRAANLTASLKKSEFVMKSLTVLGWCLEDGFIKPSQQHIESVLKIGPQKTKHGVRALLGLIGYHRHMIPNFAQITNCLTELLKKNQPEKNINWQQCHTDALNEIKRILTSKPVLVPPKFDGREFIIMSDATISAVAAILSQKDDNGVERNIAYFSRKLLPRETRYSVLELEMLGILSACLKFHDIIYGYKVVVRTDHRALEYLDTLSRHNARVARWKIILAPYNLITEWRSGANHGNCDGLSRIE